MTDINKLLYKNDMINKDRFERDNQRGWIFRLMQIEEDISQLENDRKDILNHITVDIEEDKLK